jgi:phosphopantothenoylcysteine decarboxylase/phosphopantothenate--cysteine ligase
MKEVLEGKHIVLGVTGGIAAYKSVELLRMLVKNGADVRVLMTENAGWFVGPLTFEALSGKPVCKDLFQAGHNARIGHIAWAEEADAVVVAPATANIIGKIAGGIADDALSTFLLAVTSPVLVCPSMNTNMYLNKSVQRNLEQLERDGYQLLRPDSGDLACGVTGPGRLPEPEEIYSRFMQTLFKADLTEKQILITAGPTQEPMDPVRFISNPSSGKMGFAIAAAAEQRGAQVTLVSGPTTLAAPYGVDVIQVQTAQQMAAAVFEHADQAHIVIKAAAVSDYRPEAVSKEKVKKNDPDMLIKLVRNSDILAEIGKKKGERFLVGFAAETENLDQNATDKLSQKNLDMIVGNIVKGVDSAFGSDTNQATFYYRDGSQEKVPRMEKDGLAHLLLDRIVARINPNTA